jgi:hypothetical protein
MQIQRAAPLFVIDLKSVSGHRVAFGHTSHHKMNVFGLSDAGFGVDTNRIILLFADGRKESLPLMGKEEAAEAIVEHIAVLLESK